MTSNKCDHSERFLLCQANPHQFKLQGEKRAKQFWQERKDSPLEKLKIPFVFVTVVTKTGAKIKWCTEGRVHAAGPDVTTRTNEHALLAFPLQFPQLDFRDMRARDRFFRTNFFHLGSSQPVLLV